ncbi:bifunctional uridylate/adenylate kinase [Yamadazyma tenuis]|uniref:Uridylate kinase n=1 Tax=Candida tenuis (strain ATCC 10573 / BCRC 21748 / CBS 615 / JCM 9827 / NBRC 10315 / NRRL Y-1498 / VKM Y-70) TaxID=590646 RepID=G3BAI3_CANTC|nr:UMP-CMP kinase [Yamadazyma tenuis ATCC 10573]EGV62520.1 UMP-CMP kinase [Yamadazyma tenuis ATCC 10573]WEJ92627.1 bifunctional uridylate/adenylate kinase [Yamadazyma tenuis]
MISRIVTARTMARSVGSVRTTLIREPGSLRFNSSITKPKFPSSASTTPPPPPPPPRGRILIGLGLLAAATSMAAVFYTNKSPVSAVEPQPQTGPEFPENKISVVFVLGGPGAGKGTQCAKLVQQKGFVHLSAGDLLRAEQAREGSKYGELIATCIKDGTIVPQEVTLALLKQAILEQFQKGSTRFLVDGFPRKMDQALSFEEQIAKSAFTLFFECPEQVMLARLLERGKTSGRADDNVESIRKRFKTFIDTSMPVVDYFDKQGRVVKVRCDHPVDQVYASVLEALKQRGI